MGRSNFRGGQSKRQRGIPEGEEAAPQFGHPPLPALIDVLDDDAGRSEFFDDPKELESQTGPASGESGSGPGDGEVLAGETSADEVDPRKGSSACFHNIANAPIDSREPALENPARVVLDLDLPDGLGAEAEFEAEFEAADTREEAPDRYRHGPTLAPRSRSSSRLVAVRIRVGLAGELGRGSPRN